MAYVLTASKPSSIRIACKARFLPTCDEVLVTASSNTIYIYQPNSLTTLHEVTCFGSITTISPFRTFNSALDHLFVTTVDQRYFSLSFQDGIIVTGTTGNLTTIGLVSPDMGHRVLVSSQYIILYLYNGVISIIPVHQNMNPKKRAADGNRILGNPQQVRLDELKIHEIALLDNPGGSGTTFGVLYRDINLSTHLKSYELVLRKSEVELRKGPYTMSSLEHGTSIVLSRGSEGVLCIGESAIYTKSASASQQEYPISTPTLFNSHTQSSEDNWILGDDYGLLYTLSGEKDRPILRQLSLPKQLETNERLISIPHILVSLKDELFLGSHYGDSQLLSMPSLDIIASKTNTGPIQDIVVQTPEGTTGSSSLVTASGAYKDGSLKLIKYGVGMAEKAELEFGNIRGIWGIDSMAIIVIGSIESFIVLQVSPEGEIEQIDSGEQEVLYACASEGRLLLVLRDEIRICKPGSVHQSESIHSIVAAKHQGTDIYVLSEGALTRWTLRGNSLHRSEIKKFEFEVSSFEVVEDAVAVGFWNSDRLWFGHRNLETRFESSLDDVSVPLSIVIHRLNSMELPSLLVGTNDGCVITYNFDSESKLLNNKKKVPVGTTPVSLHVFDTRQGPNVFVVTDRPTIIHAARTKLLFSGISIASCTYFSRFNSSVLQSCMIVGTEVGMKIGNVDDIQKLQFKSVPLGELPRRLVSACDVIGAITMRMEVEQATGNETQRSFLRIFDLVSYDRLDEFELQENEMCQSMCRLQVDGNDRIVVGTSFADDEADECTRGRIIVLGVNDVYHTLWVETQIEVPGSVYSLAEVNKALVAGVNSFVRLYQVTSDSIKEVSKFRSSTFALTLAVNESTILVGDLMKSVTYLRVDNNELEEIARDYVPTWMTSVSFANSEQFVGAEAEGNLLLLQKSDSPLEENKMRLDRIGEFRYGSMINKLVPGVLVAPEDTSIVSPHTLFGTVDGAIGVIGTIHPDHINLLLQLQQNLGQVKKAVGGLTHGEWRAYSGSATRSSAPLRFVDGDLIEEFLELDDSQQRAACGGLDKDVSEVEKIVETLSRLR